MAKVFVMDHPLVQHKVTMLRDKNTSTKDFRELAEEISALLQKPVIVYDEWAASDGLAKIARDVFSGAKQILGIPVSSDLRI